MINIAFIHEDFPFGGAEKVTSHIAVSLRGKGYSFFIFTCNLIEEKLSDEEKDNFNFIKINLSDLFEDTENNILIEKAKENAIDIMVFTGANFNMRREHIVNAIGCKYIFASHGTPFWEVDDINTEFERRISHKNFFSKIKYRIKHQKKLKQAEGFFINLYKTIYQSCDAFTVLCPDYQEVFSKKINLGVDKFCVIPNGVPQPKIAYSLDKKKQILYVGRMSYADKRVDRLIEIWKNIYKRFSDWEFILVGDGAERHKLEQQAQMYSLERILFCGAVQNVEKYYNQAAILCLSSQ
ncbi:MAG: glycosyltransferase [Bacteroidota bacterium]|nr:glycosyltransferase [Bacteroidota bacterium]